MYYVSTCNEGECVVDIQYRREAHTGRRALSRRQRDRPVGPLPAPVRSVAPPQSSGLDRYRPTPETSTVTVRPHVSTHASLQHASLRHPAGNTPLPEVVVFDMKIVRIACIGERQKDGRRAS